MKKRPIIDNFLNRLLSRKLIVFIVASTGLFFTKIDSTDWVIIATVYLSVEGGADIIGRYFDAKRNQMDL